MELFIGNIPRNTTAEALRSLVWEILTVDPGEQCRFSVVRSRDRNGVERLYGRVRVDSDSLGARLIYRLNGRRFGGHRLLVREYIYRWYGNERRDLNWRERPWPWTNFRVGERRSYSERQLPLCRPRLSLV